MPFSLMAFTKSTNATAYTALSNLASDQLFAQSGTTLYIVPASHTVIHGAYGMGNAIGSGGGLSRFRLVAPSVLKSSGEYVQFETVDGGNGKPSNPIPYNDFLFSPTTLLPNDTMEADVITDGGTAAQQYVVAVIGTPGIAPLDLRGKTVTQARFTGTQTLTANVWTSATLTADQALAPGTWGVIGMRAFSAGAIAARLIFPGYGYRPGCIAVATRATLDVPRFRYGAAGIWGTFDSTSLPQAEFLSSSADTAEDVILDLIPM